jgi:DNA-binding SARP family transcriptional activator
VHIGILGPLQVRGDAGQPIELGGPRLRALVIRLALAAGQTISAERLCADLWSGDGPADTGNALQALVSRGALAAGDLEHGAAVLREALRLQHGAAPGPQIDTAQRLGAAEALDQPLSLDHVGHQSCPLIPLLSTPSTVPGRADSSRTAP